MHALMAVFLGAGLGGVARYLVNITAAQCFGPGFPAGTLLVNVCGSFLMGLLTAWFRLRAPVLDPAWQLFFTTGLLGGFTTFSAFSLETAVMIEQGQWGLAALYVAASVLLALLGLFLGLQAVRTLLA